MLFNSWEFALFFGIVFLLYHVLSQRPQNVLLLVASYCFYAWWDYRFLSLLLLSTVVDYTVALRMPRSTDARRKTLLLISVCTNLGILGFFKYFGFFVESAQHLFGVFGLKLSASSLEIILPVGISFYTFQTMGYTIDVYRRRVAPTRDLLTFAVYVAYFPQLVAGPIERAQNLLPQFSSRRKVGPRQLSSGALLILIGLVRKVVIADGVAHVVNDAFASCQSATSLQLMRACFLFSLQIYCDFAGYSDIARGVSRMLGIELMENFRHPYFAANITDFWRRWHISLSTWLRDYLYIPLGGNRGTRWYVFRNLMLTMLLGGLWHGAAWTFVAWGGLHGLALACHKFWLGLHSGRGRRAQPEPWYSVRRVGSWLLTMSVVLIAWVLFRSPDFHTAFEVMRGMFVWRGGFDATALMLPAGMTCLLLFLDLPQSVSGDQTVLLRWPWAARGVVYASLVLAVVFLRTGDHVPFIYFQF